MPEMVVTRKMCLIGGKEMSKYETIFKTSVDSNVIEESFDLGEKMLCKYASFDSLMGMNPDEFEDMKQLYKLALRFKDEAVKSIKQQNQQTELLYDLTEVVKELRNEIALLRGEIDSLKPSKALKKLD